MKSDAAGVPTGQEDLKRSANQDWPGVIYTRVFSAAIPSFVENPVEHAPYISNRPSEMAAWPIFSTHEKERKKKK